MLGPNTARPCSSNRSVRPITSGASGPMTVRSTFSRLAKSRSAGRSSAAMGMLSASAAVPALPGAQKMRSASGDWAKEWTRACSLPPPPTTSTRMRPPSGCMTVRRAALPPARPDARKSTRAGRAGEEAAGASGQAAPAGEERCRPRVDPPPPPERWYLQGWRPAGPCGRPSREAPVARLGWRSSILPAALAARRRALLRAVRPRRRLRLRSTRPSPSRRASPAPSRASGSSPPRRARPAAATTRTTRATTSPGSTPAPRAGPPASSPGRSGPGTR